jgi:hypothetical protein
LTFPVEITWLQAFSLEGRVLSPASTRKDIGMLDSEKERAFVDAAIKPGLAFSLVETAQILRRNELWVRELLDSGQLRSIRLGRRRMVPRAAIIDALTEGTT